MKKIEIQQQVVSLVREGQARWVPELVESAATAAACFDHIKDLAHEEIWIVGLNNAGRPLGCMMISRGGIGASSITAADVFKPLLAMNAPAFVMAHNHPSGDPTPTEDDLGTTQRMLEAGHLLGISLMDHIVVSVNGWRSIREHVAPKREIPDVARMLLNALANGDVEVIGIPGRKGEDGDDK